VTEIREPGFFVDLPGTWEAAITLEPGSHFFHESAGTGALTVMLLMVRPSFAIADRARLLSDYMHHRASFEKGKRPALEQSEAVSHPTENAFEGSWSAVDTESGRYQLHRVMIDGDIMAHFCYEDGGMDETSFVQRAATVLGSAGIDVGAGAGEGEAS
jgi:hypothetical protein